MQKETLEEKLDKIAKWIVNSKHLVAFTGAGISTESGIPDFRGPDGVWTRRDKGLPPPKMKKAWSEVQPNIGHKALVELQKLGLLKFVITQNTDNLHRSSGIDSDKIAELHGNGTLVECTSCYKKFTYEEVNWDRSIFGPGYRTSTKHPNQPDCPNCFGRLISSVVNFGDPLLEYDYKLAYEHSEDADVFLIIGSSLVVFPAADLPVLAMKNKAKTILINKGETPLDNEVDIKIEEQIGDIMNEIMIRVRKLLY